jgi:uncharacterized membrane protein
MAETDPKLEALRKVCLTDYLLHIAGLLFSAGLLSVVAVILNYVKRDDAKGTIYYSHMQWMIRSFWWALFWVIVVGVPAVITFGILGFLMLLPAAWFLYRMIKGLLALNDGKAMPE